MRVCFRSVEKGDMKTLGLGDKDWKMVLDRRRYGMTPGPGSPWAKSPSRVVTLDGQIVLCFDATNQLLFQDDRFPIAELMRADKRVWEAARLTNHWDLKHLKEERSPAHQAQAEASRQFWQRIRQDDDGEEAETGEQVRAEG